MPDHLAEWKFAITSETDNESIAELSFAELVDTLVAVKADEEYLPEKKWTLDTSSQLGKLRESATTNGLHIYAYKKFISFSGKVFHAEPNLTITKPVLELFDQLVLPEAERYYLKRAELIEAAAENCSMSFPS